MEHIANDIRDHIGQNKRSYANDGGFGNGLLLEQHQTHLTHVAMLGCRQMARLRMPTNRPMPQSSNFVIAALSGLGANWEWNTLRMTFVSTSNTISVRMQMSEAMAMGYFFYNLCETSLAELSS